MPPSRDPATLRRRRLLQSLAAAGFSVSVAGCAGGEPQYELGPGDRSYIAGTTSGAQSLSPAVVSDEATTNRINLLYDTGGVVGDENIEFEGRLLETWSLSDDAQTVEYRVRDGLEWGAGYGQLTAEDYVYCATNFFQADWAQYSQRPSFILGGEPIEYVQTGEMTFEARLPQTRPNWFHEDILYGVWPLPKGLIQKYEPSNGGEGDLQGLNNDPAVTSGELNGNLGPFNLVSWNKGQRMVVTRNDDYYLADTNVDDGRYQGSPNLDSYTYQVFDEKTTGYSAVKAGDITAIGVEARKVSELSSSTGVEVWESKFGSGIFWLNLNFRANGWTPLRNREVRQALAHLFDRQTLIEEIFNGNANPADTFHPRWGPYYDDSQITTFEPSVEMARQKLESGTSSDYGYDDRGRFVGPDGEQVELKMVIDNTSQQGEIVGNFMRKRLESAGVALSLDGLSFGRILTTYMQNSVENNPNYSGDPAYNAGPYNGGPPDQAISREPWDIVYGVGFSASPYAPWQPIEFTLTPRGTFNFVGYRADDYDINRAVNQAPTAESSEVTQKMMTKLFGFLSREQPFVWAFNDHTNIAYRNAVGNLPEAENFFDGPSVRLLTLGTAESGTPTPRANASDGTDTGTPQ
ncbi:MAG: ABC transporter substrate-binding protein [Haloferacaceae archaeon]